VLMMALAVVSRQHPTGGWLRHRGSYLESD
jgi:hypothetical protein